MAIFLNLPLLLSSFLCLLQPIVIKAIAKYDQFLYYDHCYVGGGNAKHIKGLDLGPKVTRVSNKAGLFGGARIWDLEAS